MWPAWQGRGGTYTYILALRPGPGSIQGILSRPGRAIGCLPSVPGGPRPPPRTASRLAAITQRGGAPAPLTGRTSRRATDRRGAPGARPADRPPQKLQRSVSGWPGWVIGGGGKGTHVTSHGHYSQDSIEAIRILIETTEKESLVLPVCAVYCGCV